MIEVIVSEAECFDDLIIEIESLQEVIVLVQHMDNELCAESRKGHAEDLAEWNSPLDSH